MGSSYALASLKQTIKLEFMQPCSRVSLDDYEAMVSLYEKLYSMEAFLEEKSEGGGGVVIRDLEIKIRDFALKTEDDIEMQLSNIFQLAKDTKNPGEACRKFHQTLQEATEDAEELLKIINDTGDEAEGANDTHPSIHCLKPASQCSLEFEEKVVGRDPLHFFFETMGLFYRTNQEPTVIPVVGMPGIGKTTLAKIVYGHSLVASNFDVKAWVTVSHEYNLQQILYELLHSMIPVVEVEDGSTLFQLKEQLHKHLKNKRYFIVLDDIWDTQSYNDIQQYFPNDPCGSFILLTTQSNVVAADSLSHTYYPLNLLNENESWELFCNRLSHKEYMAPKFEEIAKHVVKQCEGLPRSIVVVAERLSKCNYTLKEWKKVKKEIDALGTLYSDAQDSRKLTLIYNRLPQTMKVCFIYFAVFPKGCVIQAKKLIRFWITEGFLKSFENTPLEDRGNQYLAFFVNRCLLLMGKHSSEYKIKTCRMHEALHSFCVREAQKEGLFCAVNTQHCLGWSLKVLENSFRWLSLRTHSLDYYVFFSTNSPRSTFFFDGDLETFVPFKLLRILYFSPSLILKSVTLHLGDLGFLRYLSVPQWFEGLDDVIASNQNLQTLIVSGDKSKHEALAHHFSSRIWELPRLCHLELGNMYTVDPPSMDKEHLETLSWACPSNFRKEVHCKFPNLRKLKIVYKDVLELNSTHGSCRNPIIILENLEYLSRLETLKIIVPVGSITLVEWPVFPANLKELSLRKTNLPVNVLRLISRLPYLESLKLENTFYNSVWGVTEGGFPKLNYLLLESRNLERWVADATNFQNLKHLVLIRCYCLVETPRGFDEIPELSSIKLEECPRCVVAFAGRLKRKRGIRVIADGIEFW